MSGELARKRALIYCAGVGSRWLRGWKDDSPKQLLEVESERLLDRTVRQFRAREIEPTIVAFDKRLKVGGAAFVAPAESTRWLVETIHVTADLWRSDSITIGVFGDVCFSEATMDKLATLCGGIRFFGRKSGSPITGGPPEVFGFSCSPDRSSAFHAAIQRAIIDAEKMDPVWADGGYRVLSTEPGSIWQPYRFLIGVDPYAREFERQLWVECNDWTDDFDTPERYRQYIETYAKRWIKQDG